MSKYIDVEEIIIPKGFNVKGEWIDTDLDNFRKYQVECSCCHAIYIGNYDSYDEPYDFNFCPNCGADMRGEK